MIRGVLLIATAGSLLAQSADPLLNRARSRLIEAIDHLPRYTCTQTINRSYFTPAGPSSGLRSCDEVMASRRPDRLTLSGTDRIRLDVMVGEEGNEVYSWPGDRVLAMERVEALAGEGPIGTGAFGPFLINIFGTNGVEFIADGAQDLDGRRAAQYRYRVPLAASHYRVIVSGVTRVVPYDGRFWLDPETAELRRLTVRTAELAPATGNCEANNTVDFTRVPIGGGHYLLPATNTLRIIRRDSEEAENVTTYAACHEFHSESTIHFGDEAVEAVAATGPANHAPFAPGVALTLALSKPIDSTTAAAGDLVEASLTKPALGSKKRIVAPAGTRVRGRITALQHRMRPFGYYAVTIAWDSIQQDGQWIPFGAKLDEPGMVLERRRLANSSRGGMVTQSRRAPASGDTLVADSARPDYVFPAGQPTHWVSIAAANGR